MTTNKEAIEITLLPREDGGLRVYSTTERGLILSGPDPALVISSIWPAILALRSNRNRGCCSGDSTPTVAVLPR